MAKKVSSDALISEVQKILDEAYRNQETGALTKWELIDALGISESKFNRVKREWLRDGVIVCVTKRGVDCANRPHIYVAYKLADE